jgi:hypothetical protein
LVIGGEGRKVYFSWKQGLLIAMDILEVEGLSVKVEGKLILRDLNFSLKEGCESYPLRA